MRTLIAQAPHRAVAFWNTESFRREHGYAEPHGLKRDLEALRHEGYVVMQGEDLSASADRLAHRFGTHNWMPDQVVIVPRALFDVVREQWRQRDPELKHLHLSYLNRHPDVQHLNSRPEGGGRRPKRSRLFEREQNELAELHFLTDPTLTQETP